ncbi:S41 family peptidase [Sporosalibacterium faouarense]|uniref:S41 family peptidase n=1 Tax=Sporosalibacterium faouarense TaxID=516123 RepID=UPI00192BF9E0|nr:S41 family peptidase [Sporosalibacterium faouarense]
MKKKITLVVITFFLLFTLIGCSTSNDVENVNSFHFYDFSNSNTQLTEDEKIEDFEFMYKIMEENYPFLKVNQRLYGIDWLANKEKYYEMIKDTQDDKEFYKALDSIIKDLHNGHTHMINRKYYGRLKRVYESSLSLNNPWLKQLNNPKTIDRYSENEKSDLDSNSANSEKNRDSISDNVETKKLEKNVAYLRIKTLSNIENDMEIIEPFINGIEDYNALIIDIRGNGGGDSRYWQNHLVPMLINEPLYNTQYVLLTGGEFTEDFVKAKTWKDYKTLSTIDKLPLEELKNLPPETKTNFKYFIEFNQKISPNGINNFDGNIYLLVDKGVYSSSEMFATFAKATKFAILVGEKTGGDGIGTDPALCALPNSGFIFRFSYDMGLTSDGTCNEEFKTEPDVKVDAEIGISISIDRTINKVLELESREGEDK